MNLSALLRDPSIAGVWKLLPERSSIRFKARTLWGLAVVNGEFTDVGGTGRITPDGVVSGRIDIRAASLRTGIGKRDEHLRSADFFDAERFPEIGVSVTGIEPAGENAATLQATLTIRGTTLPLPLSATVRRLDDGALAVTANGTIDRTRWGVIGNIIGMNPAKTAVLADAVFAKG